MSEQGNRDTRSHVNVETSLTEYSDNPITMSIAICHSL